MEIRFRIATAGDVPALQRALEQLSADLGDTHRGTEADLLRAGFGADPVFAAVLAEAGPPAAARMVGVSVFMPLFSTMRGAAGVYVSDLWVDPEMRGQKLGQGLLKAVLQEGQRRWQAQFLRLNVYDISEASRRFYERLGCAPVTSETEMRLDEAGCAALRGER